ncbi:MAG: WD40 repeat domain-containing protein [Treponema sp.]|nr:WD40 repeat domain-containing protein [Treponema sp.]
MKKPRAIRRALLPLLIFALPFQSAAAEDRDDPGAWQQGLIPGGHRGAVRALAYDGSRIISAGDDGFLEIWNPRTGAAEERFQVSPYRIISMALRPGKPELCLIESDGLGLYRISVWDYRNRAILFSLRFRDPVSYINYSAGGGFLIAARSGRTGLVFIDPETGSLLRSPEDLAGMVGFAATGRSERNMIVYFSGGGLSYWDVMAGTETGYFAVPPNIKSPVLFGNNRFFAGLDSGGLVVIDAVSGETLDRDPAIPRDAVLCAGRGAEFFCLAGGTESKTLYRFALDGSRRLDLKSRRSLPGELSTLFAAGPEGLALGSTGGGLWLADQDGEPRQMTVKNQELIVEAAASGSRLAFITEGGLAGFIPLDYFRIDSGETLKLEQGGGYTRLLAFPGAGGDGAQFLFWQPGAARLPPLIRAAEAGASPFILRSLPSRFPIRAAAAWGDKILFLDSAGTISVVSVNPSAKTDRLEFSFSSIGSLDADFINGEHVILGRSGVSGNSSFLMINIRTGETVPLPYPSSAGARVYRGASGALYAAAVDEVDGNPRTSIIRLDPANPAASIRLVEYQSEDIMFSLAETSRNLASTLGEGGAALFSRQGMLNFERSPGLPLLLIDGARFFIALDGDGNICWHDPESGKLLALFRLYQNEWILQEDGGEPRWGPVAAP